MTADNNYNKIDIGTEIGRFFMGISVTSSAFKNSDMIPSKYTADGKDISPPLKWKGENTGIKSYVVVCDDPDAPGGTWVHWILYNLPPEINELDEKTGNIPELPGNAVHGRNSWGKVEYGGPAPPSGTHRYFFTVFALDTEIHLSSAPAIEDLHSAMKGHILSEGQLMGIYKRK